MLWRIMNINTPKILEEFKVWNTVSHRDKRHNIGSIANGIVTGVCSDPW